MNDDSDCDDDNDRGDILFCSCFFRVCQRNAPPPPPKNVNDDSDCDDTMIEMIFCSALVSLESAREIQKKRKSE